VPFVDGPTGEVERWFAARTGLDLARMGPGRVREAIEAASRDAGAEDVTAFALRLEHEPVLFDDLAERLTVGETYFFRDAWHYALIADQILPTVEARRAAGGPGLRAWSAGCASGEEIYSLAILLHERGMLEDATLWATDLSGAALARAARGTYREWSLRADEGGRARRLMREREGLLELDPRIRGAVRFARLNLVDPHALPPGLSELDVVLCRNVLIYFSLDAVGPVARRLSSALVEGGWLLTGPSDPPLHELGLEAIVAQQGVVYQRRTEPPAPPPKPRRRRRGPRKALPAEPEAEITGVRRLADLDPRGALDTLAELEMQGLQDDEHFVLRANLLVSLDRAREAEDVLDRLLARSPGLAVAHFLRASLRFRAGDLEAAKAGFLRAHAEAAQLPPDAELACSDGETAGRLAEAAARHVDTLAGWESA